MISKGIVMESGYNLVLSYTSVDVLWWCSNDVGGCVRCDDGFVMECLRIQIGRVGASQMEDTASP